MPNWKDILDEVQAAGSTFDVVRRRYLRRLHELTARNVIIYYSGWLQKPTVAIPGIFQVNDSDKNGLMATVHQLDRTKGLDLILHTPGGETAATESIVDYLRAMFATNIRAIVPQIALSSGTMIALSCQEIVMGKHSSLGPIDPQIFGLPAHGIIEEFEQAAEEIRADQSRIPIWQPIIAKYTPTLIGECQKAIEWSNEMVHDWLTSGMFSGDPEASDKSDRIISELGSHALTKSHFRHISMARAKEFGVRVIALEDDQALQEAVLTLHHACIQTLASTGACKIIENHLGVGIFSGV